MRQLANRALRPAGDTDVPSKIDQSMTKIIALLRRQKGPKLLFYFDRIFAVAQPQFIGDTDAVSVGYHGAGHVVYIAEHQIRCLTSHARQREQFVHIVRYYSVILFHQNTAAVLYILRLLPKISAGFYHLLQLCDIRICKTFKRRILLKEIYTHNIDPRIGTLGRQSY